MWLFNCLRTTHVEGAFEILLRVPGLLIIDDWWQYERSKSLPQSTNVRNAIVTNLELIHGLLLLLLPLKNVRTMYIHFFSFALLYGGHLLSAFYINLEPDYVRKRIGDTSGLFLFRHTVLLILQVCLGVTASFALRAHKRPHIILFNAFTLPLTARILNLPRHTLDTAHDIAGTVVIFSLMQYFYLQAPVISKCLKELYHEHLIIVYEDNGWSTLLIRLWKKIFVANNFVAFWLGHFSFKLVQALVYGTYSTQMTTGNISWSSGDNPFMLVITIISNICNSPVSLLATAMVISRLSRLILKGTKCFLLGTFHLHQHDVVEISSAFSGWAEGIVLVFFSFQTDLMNLSMSTKIAIMAVILFLDFSTLMQSMLDITEPILLTLTTTKNHQGFKKLRVYCLCLFLFAFPFYIAYLFNKYYVIDFWIITLLSTSILTSFQVLDLIVVNMLFAYDNTRQEPWEMLDDLVYYTRALGKVMEFLLAIFVIAVGFLDKPSTNGFSTQTDWTLGNTSLILAHLYVNVWQRLTAGWKCISTRRKAAQQSDSLPSGDEEMLKEKDDLCSICFAEMSPSLAKKCCVTPCSHLFHRICLKKWLYVRNACPLCHAEIS